MTMGANLKCFFASIRNDRGFTLLELIIAIALISLIVAFLSGAFNYGRRVWEETANIQTVSTVGAVRSFLRQTFARIRPSFSTLSVNRREILFSGTETSVRFVANEFGETTTSGLYVFEIFKAPVADEEGTAALQFRQLLFRPRQTDLATALAASKPRQLLNEVTSVAFRYYGSPTRGQSKAWHRDWRHTEALPDLISVKASFPENDPRTWSELIVELKLANG